MTTIPLTRAHAIREAARALKAAGVSEAMREVRLLLADVLGVEPADLIAQDEDIVSRRDADRFTEALNRRLAGEPVSRIRGWRDFYGRRFVISPDVLDPRADTELLVEMGLAKVPEGGRVLDLGTGSGCVLVSILAERVSASGVGVDLSVAALGVSRRNGESHGVSDRASWVEGSWDAADGVFDVVVSNPPYIRSDVIPGLGVEVREHDPLLALDGGADGLDAARAILKASNTYLASGGWLAMEVGFDQTEAVMALMIADGWADVSRRRDLGGNDRVVMGRRKAKNTAT